MDWVLAVVALCLVIILHEAGHYVAAIATGMKVERFSVFGIGPVVARLGTWRGTEFVISGIPFGAYVMIEGMEPEDEEDQSLPRDPDSTAFRDRPLWARFLVLFGGPAANYLGAMAILFGVYSVSGVESVRIADFAEISSARDAGLEVGDEFIQIGDTTLDPTQGATSLIGATSRHLGSTVDVVVRRGDELVTAPVSFPPEPPALGVNLDIRTTGREIPVGQAAALAVKRPLIITQQQLAGLYNLITGNAPRDIEGPVGIVKYIKRSAEAGLVPFLLTAALISTLLGLFNLLPMPALDGGRIVFLGYELVTRRPASSRVEGMVHGIGMIALLLLIAIVTIGDLRGG